MRIVAIRETAIPINSTLRNAVYGESDSSLDEALAAVQSRSLPRERW